MNFSAWAIRKPVPSVLLFILLSAFGFIGLDKLPIQDFPDMDLPTVQIIASMEGAAPAQLETEVARKIEDKLASLTRLDHIETTITDGSVSINVTFEIDKDSNEALSEVRNAVDSARADMPQSLSDPTVSKVTSSGTVLLAYVARSDTLNEQELSWYVDNDVTKQLLLVSGVASVKRVGGVDREVLVELNPALMAGLGVSASNVSSQFAAVQKDYSGGRNETGGQRQAIRTLGAVSSPEAIAAINIPVDGNRQVRLDQIATVADSHADRSSLAFMDGEQVVAFEIQRSRGFSDVSVANAIRQSLAQFSSAHPEVQISEAYNSVDAIIENYEGSMHLLYEGALLAVIVVFIFLGNARSTFISAVALPLSVLPAFAIMYFAGFSLNTVTLLALSLVVGILVDDAIVEVENIERHLRMGKRPFDAAMEAADEIGLAVIATTFTLVAVFLPTAFMGGIPGKIFRQFGVTAAVAVLASLLVARLLTPMMAAYLLKPTEKAERESRLMTLYLKWVRNCLSNRGLTTLGATGIFALSLALIPLLPTGFLPASDNGKTQVSIEMAPGTALDRTRSAAVEASKWLMEIPEVRHVFISVGTSSSGDPLMSTTTDEENKATLTVSLLARDKRELRQSQVETQIRELMRNLPAARVKIGSGGNGETLELTLASDDADALERAAATVEAQLRGLKGIGNVTSGASLQRPELQIRPDYARAAAMGVTAEAIGNAVRIATYGDYSQYLPKLNLPERQINVRVRMDESTRNNYEAVGQLRVSGINGQVALSSLADIGFSSGPSQIDRLDRLRNVTLSVELNGRALGEVQREAMALPGLAHLPNGVHLIEHGESQRMSELFGSFGLAMAIGIFCIYAVLVLLFHDFLQPVTILSALPLAIAGALLALVLANMSFSMSSVIGILMLMGIVTKNSILLVEYAIMARRNGMARTDALIDACHKRARPIIMTTVAMGFGMAPIALGIGVDPSFRQPMAVVVIGGLIASTALSLLVVPVIFTYVDDFGTWVANLFRRKPAEGN